MPDTSVADSVSTGQTEFKKTTTPTPPNILGGKMGYFPETETNITAQQIWEEGLEDLVLDPDKATPIHMASEGSIGGFNTQVVTGATEEALGWISHAFSGAPDLMRTIAGDIGKDLIVNQVLGLGGEQKNPQPEGLNRLSPEQQAQQMEKLADAKENRFRLSRNQSLAEASAQAEEALFAREETRVAEAPITQAELAQAGLGRERSISRAHIIAQIRNEQKAQLKVQEQAPTQSPVTGAPTGPDLDGKKFFEGGTILNPVITAG